MGLLHRLTSRDTPSVWRTEARLLYRLGRVRPPVAVQWITTAVCDLTCPHCYSRAGRKLEGELTAEEAKRLIVDECVGLGRPTLVLAGGEPTLAKAFPEVVEHAHRVGVPWAMHTHGGRCVDLRPLFERCPPAMVAVSLDGPRAYHDAFRGRSGSFDAAMAAIGMFKRIGVAEVVAGTTVTRQNADMLLDLLPEVRASGADSWGLHLVTPEGRGGDHAEILPKAGQLRRVARLARRLRAGRIDSMNPAGVPWAGWGGGGGMRVELDNEWGSAGREDVFYRDGRFACGAGRVSCVVSATGEVMPCTTTDAAESAGNVRDVPLRRLWATGLAAFRDGRDPLRGDDTDCWLQTRHGRSCRGAAFLGRSDVDAAGTSVSLYQVTVRPQLSRGSSPGLGKRGARVLHSRLGQGLARAAAVAAVAMGWASRAAADAATDRFTDSAATKPTTQPAAAEDEMPDPLTQEVVRAWFDWRTSRGTGTRLWVADKHGQVGASDEMEELDAVIDDNFAALRQPSPHEPKRDATLSWFAQSIPAPRLSAMLLHDLGVVLTADDPRDAKAAAEQGVTVEAVLATLDEMERNGVYHPWPLAYLWRASEPLAAAQADPDELAGLYRRFHRHARMIDALTLAAAEGPTLRVNPQAWMSKGAPPPHSVPDDQREAAAGVTWRSLPAAWKEAGPGLWRVDGTVQLTLDAAAGTRLRLLAGDGSTRQIEPGERFTLTRLEVLHLPANRDGKGAPITLTSCLGRLTVPPASTLTAWNLTHFIDKSTRERIAESVQAVAADPSAEGAIDELEAAVPLAHAEIRETLDQRPTAEGAAALRLLLSQFDEAVREPPERPKSAR